MKRDNSSKKKPIFCSFGYVDYIVLASSIAIALGDELSSNDLNILATFFAVLSDELALISSVESTCSSDNDDEPFVAPVPTVADSSRLYKDNVVKNHNPNKSKNTHKPGKKVVRKKIKKKKTLN